MIVAIASGKGGTGKTTVSAALVSAWSRPVVAVDMDVEEPNLHLFLRPEIRERRLATLGVPSVRQDACLLATSPDSKCRACADLCQYKAISVMGRKVWVSPDMCHGCGGCMAICPAQAIDETVRELGFVEVGEAAGLSGSAIRMFTGRLRIGEAMSPPLMTEARVALNAFLDANQGVDAILDAPPGVSCPAMNACQDADVIVLVTEPTPFGLHDFRLAHQAFKSFEKPLAVVVNRAGLGFEKLHEYCREHDLPILLEIPYSRELAKRYSKGKVIFEGDAPLKAGFEALQGRLETLTKGACHA